MSTPYRYGIMSKWVTYGELEAYVGVAEASYIRAEGSMITALRGSEIVYLICLPRTDAGTNADGNGDDDDAGGTESDEGTNGHLNDAADVGDAGCNAADVGDADKADAE